MAASGPLASAMNNPQATFVGVVIGIAVAKTLLKSRRGMGGM